MGQAPQPDAPATNEEAACEIRFTLTPEAMEAFRMATVQMSEEAGRRLSTVEVFERLTVAWLTGDVMEEARKNIDARNELESCPAQVNEDTPAYDVGWVAAAAEAASCPGNGDVALVRHRPAPWRNRRLRFTPSQRHATPAQRREMLRRDGFRCSTPACPNHLWIDVHHIVFYCDGGKTIPENLTAVCSKCHRNIHEAKLVVRGTPGSLRWTDRQDVELTSRTAVNDWFGLMRPVPALSTNWRVWDE